MKTIAMVHNALLGQAANHAVKLTALPHDRSKYISAEVYKNIDDDAKKSKGSDMWTALKWNAMSGQTIYGSTY